MSIDVLTPELEGNITCRLDLGDGTDDIIGVIPIEIARPPSKIELIVQNQRNLEAGQELNAECAYRDGSPSARVSWYLGGEAIQSKEQFDHQDRDTIVSFVQHRLSDSDNLKMLVCRLDHPALPSGYTNTSEQLIVNFQPLALSRDELVVSGLEIGQTADVIVRIRANPKPRLQWTIDGTTYEEGRQTAKYIVNQAEQDEEGRWIAKLTIVDLSLQDTLRTYNLRANNNFGSNDYAVRIGGAQELDGKLKTFHSPKANTNYVIFYPLITHRLRTRNYTNHRYHNHFHFRTDCCGFTRSRSYHKALVFCR